MPLCTNCKTTHRNRSTPLCNACRPKCSNPQCSGFPTAHPTYCSKCLYFDRVHEEEESVEIAKEEEAEEALLSAMDELSFSGYTNEQQQIIDAVDGLLKKGGPRKRLLIDAPGGTGKTYTMKKYGSCSTIQFLGPTHHSVKVLKSNGIFKVMTIDKFLGMSFRYDAEGNRTKSYKPPKVQVKVIVVDECSMINDDQLFYLKEMKCHIVFMGDRAQLPPVSGGGNKAQSGVYSLDFDGRFNLTRLMRTNHPDLLAVNQYYRAKSLHTKSPVGAPSSDVFTKSSTRFQEEALEAFSNRKDAVILCYRNSTVNKYNDIVRSKLYGQEAMAYERDEVLMVDEFFTVNGRRFYTGDRFKAVAVEIVDVEVEFDEWHKTTITMYRLTDGDGVTVFKPKDEHARKLFLKLCSDIKKYIKASKNTMLWNDFEEFKGAYNAPLKYIYAMTIHKSQGQTIDRVFVTFSDVFGSQESQLKYVAVSRAKEALLILQ